jgi:hypothetical protein
MVCLRNICVNTLHKGDSIFTNNNNNNNNIIIIINVMTMWYLRSSLWSLPSGMTCHEVRSRYRSFGGTRCLPYSETSYKTFRSIHRVSLKIRAENCVCRHAVVQPKLKFNGSSSFWSSWSLSDFTEASCVGRVLVLCVQTHRLTRWKTELFW